jgi:hypothetical protein
MSSVGNDALVYPFLSDMCLSVANGGGVAQWEDRRQSHLRSRVRIPVGLVPLREKATLFDSVGFILGLRFPPTLNYKSPNIVCREPIKSNS